MIYLSTLLSRGWNLNVNAFPSGSIFSIVATVSTCPCTKCPPIRVVAETARSRLTLLFCLRDPRFVRRSVSGATPTLKEDFSKEMTVRQVPFMLMLSPRWQSSRISEALEIVRVVPPSSDCGLSSETTIMYKRRLLVPQVETYLLLSLQCR